jgi:endonuclease YncB( thermonuclease family)
MIRTLMPRVPSRAVSCAPLRRLSLIACGAAAVSLSGCGAFTELELAPVPTPVPTPSPDLFDPAAGVTALTKLNDSDPSNPQLPDKFRVVRVDTGELLALQTLSTVGGRSIPGTTDTYRLAGILTPAPGRPGFQETVSRIQRWTLGQDVDVEQDSKFPIDLNSRRMVQVFFTGREGTTKGQRLLLNRMLIRLGLAVVDINAPTSIDVKAWLNDEAFARKKGLGLWGKGITLGARIPLEAPSARAQRVVGPNGAVSVPVTRPSSSTTSTTSTATTATTASPGAPSSPPADAAPPANAPPPAPGASPGASPGP